MSDLETGFWLGPEFVELQTAGEWLAADVRPWRTHTPEALEALALRQGVHIIGGAEAIRADFAEVEYELDLYRCRRDWAARDAAAAAAAKS